MILLSRNTTTHEVYMLDSHFDISKYGRETKDKKLLDLLTLILQRTHNNCDSRFLLPQR